MPNSYCPIPIARDTSEVAVVTQQQQESVSGQIRLCRDKNGQMSATLEYSYAFRGLGLLLLFQAYCFGMYLVGLPTLRFPFQYLALHLVGLPCSTQLALLPSGVALSFTGSGFLLGQADHGPQASVCCRQRQLGRGAPVACAFITACR